MFRRATGLLARPLLSSARARARPFSTDLPVAPNADEAFVEAWKKVVPNLEPPKTPLSFMQPRPPTPSSIPSKLTVNFVLPYASELSTKEVSLARFCFLGLVYFDVNLSGFRFNFDSDVDGTLFCVNVRDCLLWFGLFL